MNVQVNALCTDCGQATIVRLTVAPFQTEASMAYVNVTCHHCATLFHVGESVPAIRENCDTDSMLDLDGVPGWR